MPIRARKFEVIWEIRAYTSPTAPYSSGHNPYAGLIADSAGNLYGTTQYSGIYYGPGTVFELATDGWGSIPLTLAPFSGSNGANPTAGVIADSAGNLFGTTYQGGGSNQGTVFELAKGSHSLLTLATFTGANGAYPGAGLIADSAGNLFGTTRNGGASDSGTVFKLAKGSGGYTLSILVSFATNTDGANPLGGLIADSAGNLFGTTNAGGAGGKGTVFQITDSGFVPYATEVPAPAGLGLFGMGLAALGLARRRAAR